MTIKEALNLGNEELKYCDICSAEIDSEVLLAFSLKIDRKSLFLGLNLEIETEKYFQFIERRKKYEPIAYIIGHKDFYGREFVVNKNVLIPRPDSELLIDEVIKFSKNIPKPINIIDVGTGSGALGITLNLEIEESSVLITDISKDALLVADENINKLNPPDITIIKSDLLNDVSIHEYDVIVANLPYIPMELKDQIMSDVRDYEPNLALFSDDFGMKTIKKFVSQITEKKIKFKALFLEIHEEQALKLTKYILDLYPDIKIDVIKNYGGYDRFLKCVIN